MSDKIRGGFIAVPRAIFTDTNFASEPFTEMQAVLNLVADAGWQPRRVRLARGAGDLQRGQLLASTRFLAERWQWPEPRVRRFLNRISGRRANDAQTASQNDAQNETRSDALIDAQPTRDGTIITIRNYDAFQKSAVPPDNPIDAQSDARNETQSDAKPDAPSDPKSTQREEIINNNYLPFPEGNGEARASTGSNVVSLSEVGSTPKVPDPEFAQFAQTLAGTVFGKCREYLQRAADLSPDQASRMLGRWRKTNSDGEIIDAISRAQREEAQDPVAFINGCFRQRHRGQRPTGAMSAIQAMEDVQ
jgi:hypothetical protein